MEAAMTEATTGGAGDSRTLHRCACGHAVATMDGFVDHVSDAHEALDIAVKSLHDETVTVVDDGEDDE
jgi:hypothetical protein